MNGRYFLQLIMTVLCCSNF